MERTFKNGDIFGEWIILNAYPNNKKMYAFCRCSCGLEKMVLRSSLRTGKSDKCASCGKTKHGMSKTRINKIWRGMKTRCLNKNVPEYRNYGGRGIKVCDDWKSFEKFYEDMGEPPTKKHSLERIDNNGNYNKQNCKWATPEEQSNNTRRNRYIKYNDDIYTLSEWSKKTGLSYPQLRNRLNRGWNIKRALTNNN